MSHYKYMRVLVDELAGPDAPTGIRRVWEGRGWELMWTCGRMMGFAKKLPPAGLWEAIGEYMAEDMP